MSENAEVNPVGESPQAPVGSLASDPEIQRLKAHNAQLIQEKQSVSAKFDAMQKQIRDLENLQSKAKQSKLKEQGEFESLWKEAQENNAGLSKKISDLEQQLQEKENQFTQQQIKAKAVSTFQQAGAQQPDHMYQLHADKLRMNGENLMVVDGGIETPLTDFVGNLKSTESSFAYMFNSSGAKGMGAVESSKSVGGGENPYLTKNFTEVVRLEAENPELAARLRAQAAK